MHLKSLCLLVNDELLIDYLIEAQKRNYYYLGEHLAGNCWFYCKCDELNGF